MEFIVIIPARFASTRLPGKMLADIGGKPMVIHVADRARASGAAEVVIATDHRDIAQTALQYGHLTEMTRAGHASGTDRIAEVVARRRYPPARIVVNVQGDEPLIEPALIDAVAAELQRRGDCAMSTAAHAIGSTADFLNPNVVKVVLDRAGTALYFSRAPIAWWRDGMAALGTGQPMAALPSPAPLRHVGIYAYRAGFLRQFPVLEPAPLEATESLEQLRALWHGHRIAVHVTAHAPGPGVDTVEDLQRVRALLARA